MPETRILVPELMWQKLVRLASGQYPEIVIFTRVMPRASGNIPEKDVIYGWVKAIDFLRYEALEQKCYYDPEDKYKEDALMAWTWDWVLFTEYKLEEGDLEIFIKRIPRHPNAYEAYRKDHYNG